jgi:hypothetical protein
MKRAILSAVVWAGLSASVSAQSWKPDSVIQKDGSHVTGLIIEILPEDTLFIATAPDFIQAIPVEQIERIHIALKSRHLTIKRQGRDRRILIPGLLPTGR